MLARSKVNSIKALISQALINNEFNHEDFMKVINEEKNYRELKESLRTMKSQRSDTGKIIWLKKAKIGIDEIIKRNAQL